MQAVKFPWRLTAVLLAYLLLFWAVIYGIEGWSNAVVERNKRHIEMLKKLERLERQTRELVDDTAQVQSMVDELVKRSESAK